MRLLAIVGGVCLLSVVALGAFNRSIYTACEARTCRAPLVARHISHTCICVEVPE